MAKVVTDDSHYKAIADTIRNNPVTNPGEMQPKDMPKEIESVIHKTYLFGYGEGERAGYSDGFQEGYDDGFAVGEESGIAEGVEQGKQAEYDRFWDAYQQNGNRTAYRGGFGGKGWTENTFYPKYDIIPTAGCANLFFDADFGGDLAQRLDEQGVVLDTSNATIVESMFSNNLRLTRVGVINISNAGTRTSSLFGYCIKLVTIDKFVVAETNAFASTFQECQALENLTIEGTIGKSGLSLQWSTKLSKASITSVVNALSSTTSGLSVTFSKTAVDAAFTDAEWSALAGTKTNWTINLM